MNCVWPVAAWLTRIIHSHQSNGESSDNMGTMCVASKTLCPT